MTTGLIFQQVAEGSMMLDKWGADSTHELQGAMSYADGCEGVSFDADGWTSVLSCC